MFDEKDVIGYRPKLDYRKDSNYKKLVQAVTESANKDLEMILKSSPGKTIQKLNSVIDNADLLINSVLESADEKDLEMFYTAITLGKDEYVKEILDLNDTIQGNTSYEVVFLMNLVKDNLKSVVNTLKTLYYGNENITLEQQEEKESIIYQSILSKDGTEDSFGIKYNLLHSDAILNKSIENVGFFVNKAMISFAGILSSGTIAETDSSNEVILSKMFETKKKKNNDRLSVFQQQLDRNLAQKTLYNYYDKRKELIQLDQLCVQSGIEIPLFQNELENKQLQVDDSIKEVSKFMLFLQTQLSSFETTIKSKEQIRKVYQHLID